MSLWRSLSEKLKNAGNKWTQSVSNLFSDEPLTDEFWDELEELILGDVGIETTETLIEKLRKTSIDKELQEHRTLKPLWSFWWSSCARYGTSAADHKTGCCHYDWRKRQRKKQQPQASWRPSSKPTVKVIMPQLTPSQSRSY